MKKKHLTLSDKDREYLKLLLSKGIQKVRLQKRVLGVQMLDEGLSYKSVSDHLGMTPVTISSWARKYKKSGLVFLEEKPRSGRPIGLSGEDRAKVTALACSKPPKGYAKWSLRLLSDRLVELEIVPKISHTKVGDILKKTNFNRTEKNNGVLEP